MWFVELRSKMKVWMFSRKTCSRFRAPVIRQGFIQDNKSETTACKHRSIKVQTAVNILEM